jgi:Tol biopolymer transport system component
MTMKSPLRWISGYVLLFLLAGCNFLWEQPQIPAGGLNSKAADEYPAYSGDGRYLAFASDRNGRRNIYLYDLQARRLIKLPKLNRPNSSQDQPSLSENGRYMVYVSTERGKTDIMLYDRTRARSRLLTAQIKGTVRYPTINGDGTAVAFQTSQGGQWNLAIVELE